MELVNKSETGVTLSLALSTNSKGRILDLEARCVIASNPNVNLLSATSGSGKLDVGKNEPGTSFEQLPHSKGYEELLEVVTQANVKLNIT